MSTFASDRPPSKQIVTTTGVTVVVKPPKPPPAAEPTPPRRPRFSQAIVVPAGLSPEDLELLVATLFKEHVHFIQRELVRRKILEESAKDLAQEVILTLWRYLQGDEPLENVRGFLVDVLTKKAADHLKMRRRRVDRETSPSEETPPGPEEALCAGERLARLKECIADLPQDEQEAVVWIHLLGNTLETLADQIGKAKSTLADRRARGIKKIRARMCEEREDDPPAGQGRDGG